MNEASARESLEASALEALEASALEALEARSTRRRESVTTRRCTARSPSVTTMEYRILAKCMALKLHLAVQQ